MNNEEIKNKLSDEVLNEVSGGLVDVSTKKSIGHITILADRVDYNTEPKFDYFKGVALKGETYQIYAIRQGDGRKWFLLDNGYYIEYNPTKMSLTFTF